MNIEIVHDVYYIAERLKEIDFNYFILYNTKRKKYEIHHAGQSDTYCLTVPYDELDACTIDFVNQTRVENRDRLLKELDEENRKRGVYEG